MNIEQEIKKLRNKLDELEKQVNAKNKIIGRYIPNDGDTYFYVDSNFTKSINYNKYYPGDEYKISIGNCFRTEEEAEKYKRILINTQKLKDLAERLNDGEKVDWSAHNSQAKYCLCFYTSNTLKQSKNWDNRMQGAVYCLDKNFFEKAVEEIGEENLIELIKG